MTGVGGGVWGGGWRSSSLERQSRGRLLKYIWRLENMQSGCRIRLLTVLRIGDKIAKFKAVKEKCKVVSIPYNDRYANQNRGYLLPKGSANLKE